MITFRTVVKQALARALKLTEDDRDMRRFADVLAKELRANFLHHGYVVKANAQGLDLGREMTHDEQVRVGLISDGDVPSVRSEDGIQGLPGPPEDPQQARLPAAGGRDEGTVRD